MLLSDRDIAAEIKAGRVQVEPFEPKMIQPSSVDVRLDRFFRVFENHRYEVIDPSIEQPDLTREVAVAPDDFFILHPGEFVLASTYEVITLPDDIAGRWKENPHSVVSVSSHTPPQVSSIQDLAATSHSSSPMSQTSRSSCIQV